MDHPYRQSENESIIIDTRLTALEEQTKSVVTWRRLSIVFAALTAFTSSYAFYAGSRNRVNVAETPCRDEVILASSSAWSNSTVATCTHPKHQSTVRGDKYDTSIHCVCR